jgi:divalent metal cation (Fe/Co/Zn/Cd) transporter
LIWRNEAETSTLGIAVASVAAIAMPILARAKVRAATAIGSRGLRADAMETLTCGYLAWVLLAGLLANAVFHWWWLDAAASLAIVPLSMREAKEAVSGGECCGQRCAGAWRC